MLFVILWTLSSQRLSTFWIMSDRCIVFAQITECVFFSFCFKIEVKFKYHKLKRFNVYDSTWFFLSIVTES